jgi:hypothetical protein
MARGCGEDEEEVEEERRCDRRPSYDVPDHITCGVTVDAYSYAPPAGLAYMVTCPPVPWWYPLV